MNQPSQIIDWLEKAPKGSSVFLVGVGGCGMACLGHLLLDRGFTVSGSDLAWNDATRLLVERKAVLYRGHEQEHIVQARPALIVYSSAIPKDNLELLAAKQLGIPTVRRASLLAGLMGGQPSVAVVGTHGKTTTSALLAFVLKELGAPISYAIGGDVPQLIRPAKFHALDEDTSGEESRSWFVAEIDESDGGLGEFTPGEAMILNVADDHLDYFASIDRIRAEFASLIDRTAGKVVFCADDARLGEICSKHAKAISYGYHPLADYRIELRAFDAAQPSIERFGIWQQNRLVGEFTLQLPGKANVSNAASVIVWLLQHGYSAKAIAGALARFKGVLRRQETVFADSRFRVIDDYAHHPTAIQETIQAVKRFSPKRLIVAFQPHRFARTESLMQGFANCFRGADQVWLTEIHSTLDSEVPGVSGKALVDVVAAKGMNPGYEPTLEALRKRLFDEIQSGDLVLCLGAGAITQVAHQLAAELTSSLPTVANDFVPTLERELSSGSELRVNEPLAKRTTLRVGGPAEIFLEPASVGDLCLALERASEAGVPVFILGRGSNLLIRDAGIRGLVISLTRPAFSEMIVRGDRITCGAGARLRAVAGEARRCGLTGLEFLEGIPGTIGGALRMNAGAMGAWMFDVVESVKFVDFQGQLQERKASELYVEYRGCPLLRNHLAVEAVLKGELSSEEAVRAKMNKFSSKRWESQPAAPSAGCIFKNPDSVPAGKLIDELGLKGTRVGGASVSDVHGNFIVNDGSATADDVLNLIDVIQRRARQTRGIDLRTEVQIVGG